MKKLTVLLFLASVALNVCFFAGCKSLHDFVYDYPCKYGPKPINEERIRKEALEPIVKLLRIESSDKTSSDLVTKITNKLTSRVDVPLAYDAFGKMEKDLNPNERAAMRGYHSFISELQGKTVIAIEPED